MFLVVPICCFKTARSSDHQWYTLLLMLADEHFHTDDPDKHQTTGQIYLDLYALSLICF